MRASAGFLRAPSTRRFPGVKRSIHGTALPYLPDPPLPFHKINVLKDGRVALAHTCVFGCFVLGGEYTDHFQFPSATLLKKLKVTLWELQWGLFTA